MTCACTAPWPLEAEEEQTGLEKHKGSLQLSYFRTIFHLCILLYSPKKPAVVFLMKKNFTSYLLYIQMLTQMKCLETTVVLFES